MTDIMKDLADLHKQATTDNSHFYTAKVISAAMVEITRMRQALAPFALYAEGRAAVHLPDDFPITKGSSMARDQLTMGNCRHARDAIAAGV